MMSVSAGAPQPCNGEGRPGTGRPSNFVNHDTGNDSAMALRLQLLTARVGLSNGRARLVSNMIWGTVA